MTKFVEKWGRDTARERYGAPNPGSMKAAEGQELPQSPEDKQGPKYANQTSGWVRGDGEDATNKPGFDKSKAGRA